MDVYEDASVLAEYLLFHYGTEEEILPAGKQWPDGMRQALDFAVRTPKHFSTKNVALGLDLGCAVGRSTFEMTKTCAEVLGIDFSHSFIDAAKSLAASGEIRFLRKDEGNLKTQMKAELPSDIDAGKARFLQGDAMNLPADLGQFDRVHAANLLCRLRHPKKLLERFADLLVPGGELVLATPCTWLEGFTPVGNWPEGGTLEWLDRHLKTDFERLEFTDEAFLIRETSRKFQWTSSMLTTWRRR